MSAKQSHQVRIVAHIGSTPWADPDPDHPYTRDLETTYLFESNDQAAEFLRNLLEHAATSQVAITSAG